MTLACFERALRLASDETMADVWFNIAHVAIGVGDLDMAQHALEIAIGVDSTHSESHNNLGVLEARKGNNELATSNFAAAAKHAEWTHEPLYNAALCAFKKGSCLRVSQTPDDYLPILVPEGTVITSDCLLTHITKD
jgi:tetratricopeptide repeat protein 8